MTYVTSDRGAVSGIRRDLGITAGDACEARKSGPEPLSGRRSIGGAPGARLQADAFRSSNHHRFRMGLAPKGASVETGLISGEERQPTARGLQLAAQALASFEPRNWVRLAKKMRQPVLTAPALVTFEVVRLVRHRSRR